MEMPIPTAEQACPGPEGSAHANQMIGILTQNLIQDFSFDAKNFD